MKKGIPGVLAAILLLSLIAFTQPADAYIIGPGPAPAIRAVPAHPSIVVDGVMRSLQMQNDQLKRNEPIYNWNRERFLGVPDPHSQAIIQMDSANRALETSVADIVRSAQRR